jgi:hypothetical protein
MSLVGIFVIIGGLLPDIFCVALTKEHLRTKESRGRMREDDWVAYGAVAYHASSASASYVAPYDVHY